MGVRGDKKPGNLRISENLALEERLCFQSKSHFIVEYLELNFAPKEVLVSAGQVHIGIFLNL